jgi:hypothetical protein
MYVAYGQQNTAITVSRLRPGRMARETSSRSLQRHVMKMELGLAFTFLPALMVTTGHYPWKNTSMMS